MPRARYEEHYGHFSNRQLMKMKVDGTDKKRSKKRRTIDEMIYESNYGATKVVGWGDGNKFSGFKGTSYGAPMVKIRRHAQKNDTYVNPGRAPRGTRKWTRSVQYVLINEHLTSKRSCCCVCDTKNTYRTRPPNPDVDGDHERIEKIHEYTCTSTWNRDFLAAINIFQILYHLVLGLERPAKFTNGPLDPRSPARWWNWFPASWFPPQVFASVLPPQ